MSTVTCDSRAVVIDDRRTLILSGAIHYPRSTPAMWPRLMERSREAGLNTVETYVFWNLHERRRGAFDFSGRLDLPGFVRTAHVHGLKVILRLGPYICAETNYGGLPFWLRDLPGMQIRTDNGPFKQEMARWMRFVAEMMRPLTAPNGGPIILTQIENEYDNVAKNYGEAGRRYLQWASDLGNSLALGVPGVMCVGGAEGAIETLNAFRAHPLLEGHFAKHPDQPGLWTEMWPGWYNTFGAARRVRRPAETAYAVARFFAAGGTGVNYYMWHGGTNFGRETMYLQTPGYDFDAPLDEYGRPTVKSRHLGALHRVLAGAADALLAADRPPAAASPDAKQGTFVYGQGKDAVTFFYNDDPGAPATVPLPGGGGAQELEALSVRILRGGELLFDSAAIPADDARPAWRPVPDAALDPWQAWPEPLPARWPAAWRDGVTVETPVEQLRFTQDDTDYCWYETDWTVPADAAGQGTLTLERCADVVHVFVDGQFAATSRTPLLEDRGPTDGGGFRQEFAFTAEPGGHRLSLLCGAVGLIKGDWMIGQTNMVHEKKGIWGAVRWNGAALCGPWQLQPGLAGERGAVYGTAGELLPWEGLAGGMVRPLTWLRTKFRRPAGEGAVALDLAGMGKGIAWLNGQMLGRYWLVAGGSAPQAWQAGSVEEAGIGEPTQRVYHLPGEWLREENALMLFEETGGDASRVAVLRER